MPRSPSPDVRSLLIERAAAMLSKREPVTLRSLVAGSGVSTMAVYTYFDGMPGLWGAVRQEGFRRLAERTQHVAVDRDPVRHLASLGVAYADNAVSNPDLYRVMFDATFDLPDAQAADHMFAHLVSAAQRAIDVRRFAPTQDPSGVALELWSSGHGIVSLVVTGVLTPEVLRQRAPSLATAVFVNAGDDPDRARRSVAAAWRSSTIGT